jgi:hypothetical protein
MEFFLARQATILTANYLLTCKEVSVRGRWTGGSLASVISAPPGAGPR